MPSIRGSPAETPPCCRRHAPLVPFASARTSLESLVQRASTALRAAKWYASATLLGGALASLSPASAEARTWRVTPTGDGDAPTIQAAMDSATASDEVVLAPGTYTWTSQGVTDTSMVTVTPGVSLRGEGGAEATVLDGERRGRLIRCHDVGEVRIEGLTITNGYRRLPLYTGSGNGIYSTGQSRLTIASCIVSNNQVDDGNRGGGIACDDLGSTVIDCTIRDNVAAYDASGAGIYIRGGIVKNCLVTHNRVVAGDGAGGGGIRGANATILDCVIEGNTCEGTYGASGGGIIILEGGIIERTLIAGNSAQCVSVGRGRGGGVFSFASATISDCIFLENTVSSAGYPGYGGAVATGQSISVVVNRCTAFGNRALPEAYSIGGIHLSPVSSVTATLIAGSTGAACGGGAAFTCCDFYNNSWGDASCLATGAGNFSADPLFCAADPVGSRDVRISNYSPCANPPDPSCRRVGAGEVGCAVVEVRRSTWAALKALYR